MSEYIKTDALEAIMKQKGIEIIQKETKEESKIKNKTFYAMGKFNRISYYDIQTFIRRQSGFFEGSLFDRTDYIIVGDRLSPYEAFQLEKIKENKIEGKNIVLNEDEFLDMVDFDSDLENNSPFYNKYVVFTGGLKELTRSEAEYIIESLGGKVSNSVSYITDILVKADNKSHTTYKEKQALMLNENGASIEIIDEDTFYEWIQE